MAPQVPSIKSISTIPQCLGYSLRQHSRQCLPPYSHRLLPAHDPEPACPQTVECTEDSNGPQTRCCLRNEYNKDIAELLRDGSKHFHALEQLRSQRERIVTEKGKMSHRQTISGCGGVRGKIACGTTDGVRSKCRQTSSLSQRQGSIPAIATTPEVSSSLQ